MMGGSQLYVQRHSKCCQPSIPLLWNTSIFANGQPVNHGKSINWPSIYRSKLFGGPDCFSTIPGGEISPSVGVPRHLGCSQRYWHLGPHLVVMTRRGRGLREFVKKLYDKRQKCRKSLFLKCLFISLKSHF